MFDEVISGGRKVPKKPNLGAYDNRRPPSASADPAYNDQFNGSLYADAPRTQPQDKALLVALGVNGEVPFDQARRNAGLNAVRTKADGSRHALRMNFVAANDNTKLAARAA